MIHEEKVNIDKMSYLADKQKSFLTDSVQEEEGEILRSWLNRLRRRLPQNGKLALTMHRERDRHVLLCFRVSFSGEELVSESRALSVSKAAQLAGEQLEDWLAS